jgi:hypothetical protein
VPADLASFCCLLQIGCAVASSRTAHFWGISMARIKQRRGRHFMDENGRLFWINGPEEHCYLSEQRQWRRDLSFDDVLDWKQCAPCAAWVTRWRPIGRQTTTSPPR